MRVIICGAGQVGYNIAEYLSREDSDITVIDTNPDLVAHIMDELDVNGIVGHASRPDILDAAGAADADMVLAVTHADEVNMVACQVAHSLFNVPKKIARVREQGYLDTRWANLFSRAHMPIDVIISPEIEVARTIVQRLSVPGTTNVTFLADGEVLLVGVSCHEDCPVLYTQLKQIHTLFPGLFVEIGAIVRKGETIIPTRNDQLEEGDEVYFFTDRYHLQRAMMAFGHQEKEARHITIMGGGNIGLYLAELLEKEFQHVKLKILERDEERAKFLSENLEQAVVIHGDALQQDILEEANISRTETLIAVTNDDETNILGSLLAKNMGCENVITLVTKPDYAPLVAPIGIDGTISPRTITVSSIMQYVRRGRVKALHNICNGHAEVIEVEVSENSPLINKVISEISLPKGVIIGAVLREKQIITPSSDCVIRSGDHVMVITKSGQARKIEKLFMPQVNIF